MGEKREKNREKNRESRAVVQPLQGGGMVMFSCTADGADALEAVLDEARRKKRQMDIAEVLSALTGV